MNFDAFIIQYSICSTTVCNVLWNTTMKILCDYKVIALYITALLFYVCQHISYTFICN